MAKFFMFFVARLFCFWMMFYDPNLFPCESLGMREKVKRDFLSIFYQISNFLKKDKSHLPKCIKTKKGFYHFLDIENILKFL